MEDVDGLRVRISSRRSQALIAMLATARNGERTRAWLQAHLWSTRAESQAKASLRRELSNLRPLLNTGPRELLRADHERVKIELLQLDVDPIDEHRDAEFLEGLEIPGEEEFEDWLREMRSAIRSGRSVQPTDAKNESQTGLRTTTSSFPTISNKSTKTNFSVASKKSVSNWSAGDLKHGSRETSNVSAPSKISVITSCCKS